MTKEFSVEQSNDGAWEVRDRAGVWYAEFDRKADAQRDAKARNEQAGS